MKKSFLFYILFFSSFRSFEEKKNEHIVRNKRRLHWNNSHSWHTLHYERKMSMNVVRSLLAWPERLMRENNDRLLNINSSHCHGVFVNNERIYKKFYEEIERYKWVNWSCFCIFFCVATITLDLRSFISFHFSFYSFFWASTLLSWSWLVLFLFSFDFSFSYFIFTNILGEKRTDNNAIVHWSKTNSS